MNRSRLHLTALFGAILVTVGPLVASAEEPRLSVTYDAPRLSVEASGVTIADVLRKIGEAVGFSVVNVGSWNTLTHLSLRDAPVPQALQRLLRLHDHVVVYGDAQTVERVILIGDSLAVARATSDRPDFLPDRALREERNADLSPESAAVPGERVTSATTQASIEEFRRVAEASPAVVNATDLLFRHVWSTSPASAMTQTPTAAVADPGSALAVTTALARQSLAVLTNALSTATGSMLSSKPR